MSLTNSILQSVIVLGDFIDGIGHVNITQTYLNTNSLPAESMYNFELDSNCIINSFSMVVGERVINGQVKEKTQASQEYSDAKDSGKKTSLLTKLSDTHYYVKIAGVNPNEKITINYSYVTTLDQDDLSRYKFILPTNIAPKYTGSSSQTVADSIFAKVMNGIRYLTTSVGYNFSLELRFISGNRIKGVESLTNKIDVEIVDLNKVIVRSKTIPSKGNFNVFVSTEISPAVYKWSDPEQNTYWLITHKIPDEIIENVNPKNYYFFLDRSGSMGGEKIKQAKNALANFIEQIDVNSFFNVYSFGSNYTKLTPGLTQATNMHKGYARGIIQSFDSNMGGTEIYECLKNALDDNPSNTFEKIFVFLTDGQVSNTHSITNLIKSKSSYSSTRIFSIGIGSDADRNLVKMMADQTSGECKFITDIKDLSLSIQSILTLVNKQYYSNVRLGSEQILYPSIYPGRTYNWVCLTKQSSDIDLTIKATNPIDGMEKTWDLSTIPEGTYSDKLISQLYANMLIKYLDSQPRTPELVDQIIRLSVEYQIMSSHTSYILVDSEITVTDPSKSIEVSVPHYASVSQNESVRQMSRNVGKTSDRHDEKCIMSMDMNTTFYKSSSPFYKSPTPFGGGSFKVDKVEEVDILEGGMDMFGGGSSTKKVPKYNTTMNLFKLIKVQELDGSFEIIWKDLLYESHASYLETFKLSGITSNGYKLYNNIIMYGYLKNSMYKSQFEKLGEWFIRFYPDYEIAELAKIFSIHMDYIKSLEAQTVTISCLADY